MKIRRLYEKVEDTIYWYFEIRFYHFDDNHGEYYTMNLDEDFDDYDWEEEAGRDISQDEEIYTNLIVHLMKKYPNNIYKLVKITEEVVSNEKLNMFIQTKKYNL